MPQLLVFATLVLMCFLAVIAIAYAHAHSSAEKFGTFGHKSSEFKVVAMVILILLVGMWSGVYAVLGLQSFTDASAGDYVELTKALTSYASNASWCISLLAAVYVVCRSCLKVGTKK